MEKKTSYLIKESYNLGTDKRKQSPSVNNAPHLYAIFISFHFHCQLLQAYFFCVSHANSASLLKTFLCVKEL